MTPTNFVIHLKFYQWSDWPRSSVSNIINPVYFNLKIKQNWEGGREGNHTYKLNKDSAIQKRRKRFCVSIKGSDNKMKHWSDML